MKTPSIERLRQLAAANPPPHLRPANAVEEDLFDLETAERSLEAFDNGDYKTPQEILGELGA